MTSKLVREIGGSGIGDRWNWDRVNWQRVGAGSKDRRVWEFVQGNLISGTASKKKARTAAGFEGSGRRLGFTGPSVRANCSSRQRARSSKSAIASSRARNSARAAVSSSRWRRLFGDLNNKCTVSFDERPVRSRTSVGAVLERHRGRRWSIQFLFQLLTRFAGHVQLKRSRLLMECVAYVCSFIRCPPFC
jgi:hypothetical protein